MKKNEENERIDREKTRKEENRLWIEWESKVKKEKIWVK